MFFVLQVLWKAYIDFEISEGQRARTRELYKRLLIRTGHVKVWMSYAQFESTPLPLLGADVDDEDGTVRSVQNTTTCMFTTGNSHC